MWQKMITVHSLLFKDTQIIQGYAFIAFKILQKTVCFVQAHVKKVTDTYPSWQGRNQQGRRPR